jgi:(p)ppGpp synthase/HD superfamily hydrolase
MYSKAIIIVNEVFKEKKDKGGNPYIYHLYSVSNNLEKEEEKTAGLLHDIIEDTEITYEDLEEVGFTKEILEVLELVTRKKTETYDEFINRIIESNNITALKVKQKDMENNMDLRRIKNPTEEDKKRIKEKYQPQYKKIIKKIGEYYDRH